MVIFHSFLYVYQRVVGFLKPCSKPLPGNHCIKYPLARPWTMMAMASWPTKISRRRYRSPWMTGPDETPSPGPSLLNTPIAWSQKNVEIPY